MRLIAILSILFSVNILFAANNNFENIDNLNITDAQWSNLANSIDHLDLPHSFSKQGPCVDADTKTMHETYAVSFDREGQLCRVYDLSFPHLGLIFKRGKNRSLTTIPAQNFTRRDFANWINGNYAKVYESVESFQNQKIDRTHKQLSPWVKKLRFKKGTAAFANFTSSEEIPHSFYASDVEIGRKLTFSKYRKIQLKRVLKRLAKSQNGINNLNEWEALIDQPESLLKKIRFDWNSVKKVYEIAIEGQFLPINGPIALVNFDRPHKVFVEGLLRRVTQMAFEQIFKRIPSLSGRVIGLAVNEAFVTLDAAYAYQMNRLEASLKDSLKEDSLILSTQEAKRGLNHVYIGQVDLISEAILRMAQGQKFPWNKLEKLGRKQHFQTEKTRDIMMDGSNNYLVKKKGCATEFKFEYFSNCQTSDSTKLYTLISQFNVFSYNFGPSQIFDYQQPKSVLTKRSISYLLSIGLSVTRTPIPRWITNNLITYLKQFAFSGTSEEAYLVAKLNIKNLREGLLPAEKPLLNSLYLQNLNIFTPKSSRHEARIISANKKILGIN